MKMHAVLSALGRDRIGVADELAAELTQRKIAIEDSRMTTLRGHSALIVHICGDKSSVGGLQADLEALSARFGFHLQVEPIDPTRPTARARRYTIEAFSPGQPGIGAVTAVLRRHDINIDDLETEASSNSWSSAIAFHMTTRVTVPSSYSFAALREELRELERERNLDIVIKPIPVVASE